MNEAKIQTMLNKWLVHNWGYDNSGAVELKLTKTKRFNLKKIPIHQNQNLHSAKHKIVVYKIPDVGKDQKPFDVVILKNAKSFLAVIFYIPRKPKIVYLIDIDTINDLIERGVKSITEHDAAKYAIRAAVLK